MQFPLSAVCVESVSLSRTSNDPSTELGSINNILSTKQNNTLISQGYNIFCCHNELVYLKGLKVHNAFNFFSFSPWHHTNSEFAEIIWPQIFYLTYKKARLSAICPSFCIKSSSNPFSPLDKKNSMYWGFFLLLICLRFFKQRDGIPFSLLAIVLGHLFLHCPLMRSEGDTVIFEVCGESQKYVKTYQTFLLGLST